MSDRLIKLNVLAMKNKSKIIKNESDEWLINQFFEPLENEILKLNSFKEKLNYLNNFINNKEWLSEYSNRSEKEFNLSLNELIVDFGKVIEKEFLSSNEVIIISPFISSVLVTKLEYWLKENKKLKVEILTTTFDGSSKFLALDSLINLNDKYKNRIKIKIENNFKLKGDRLHIKAYCFKRGGQMGSLYIGSNNFTNSGIYTGGEYSIKVSEFRERRIFKHFIEQYLMLIQKENIVDINDEEEIIIIQKAKEIIDMAQKQFDELKKEKDKVIYDIVNKNENGFKLFDYQIKALQNVDDREAIGKHKHLLVMATGTGKTLTIAEYYNKVFQKAKGKSEPRLLFIAHQKEILEQAISTFSRHVKRNDGNFSELANKIYDGQKSESLRTSSINFATIQTIKNHIKELKEVSWDLVVFDEAHHLEANTFSEIFSILEPISKTIVGLTATPERNDGIDIKKYFDYEYAFELRLNEAIQKNLLSKFDYFFVKDDSVDLSNLNIIKDKDKIGEILSTAKRSQFVIEKINENIGQDQAKHRSIVMFCQNQLHAKTLSKYLNDNGYVSDYLVSFGENKKDRELILNNFKNKKINFLCVRDILNEGVDVPNIDTLFFLRPTQSSIIYIQQLGRGLRKVADKKLSVFDFVNNINVDVNKKYNPFMIMDIFKNDKENINKKLIKGEVTISETVPTGCEIFIEKIQLNELIKKLSKIENSQRISEIFKKSIIENTYNSYKEFFISNNHIDNMSQYNVYKNNKTYLSENKEYSSIFKKMSIMNSKQILVRWIDIVRGSEMDVNNIIDKMFAANLYTGGTKLEYRNDVREYWNTLSRNEMFKSELHYVLRLKLETGYLHNNDHFDPKIKSSFKGIYFTHDQCGVFLENVIRDNKYFKNANVGGLYRYTNNLHHRIIDTSLFREDTEFNHSNYFDRIKNVLKWETPDYWRYLDGREFDLKNESYSVFYKSEVTKLNFNGDDKVREYLGDVDRVVSISSREKVTKGKKIIKPIYELVIK